MNAHAHTEDITAIQNVSHQQPTGGVWLGPDGFVVPLREGDERAVRSKLGPYFASETGSFAGARSLFAGGSAELAELAVLVGVYEEGEDIPYSGGVLDMTSG